MKNVFIIQKYLYFTKQYEDYYFCDDLEIAKKFLEVFRTKYSCDRFRLVEVI